jgi:outer membrane autotransporter protein
VPPGVGSPGAIQVNTGNFAVFFGGQGPGLDTLQQSVRTTSSPLLKGDYRISFAFGADNFSGAPSTFRAVWNGQTIYSTTNTRPSAYQQLVFNTGPVSTTSSTLAFQAYNNPGYYFLDDVSVTLVKLEQGSFTPYARTPNQHAVAVGLDRSGFNPMTSPVLQYLDIRDVNQLPGDFDRISPEGLTSMFTMGVALEQQNANNMQRRTDDLRSGASGFNAANLAINGNSPSYSGSLDFRTGMAGPNGNDGKEVKESKAIAPAENRWGVFLSGTGEWVNVGDTNNARGYDLTSGGFTLGVDYKVCPNFAIGLAAGYTGTTADLSDHGRIWVNGGKLGLYSTVFSGGWYADIAAFGGYNSYDTRRSGLGGEARGDTDGGELDGLFGTGYDFKAGGLTFGPTASFNYTYVGTSDFTEHGSLAPLDVHGGKGESLRTAFGLKASYDLKLGGIVLRPEVRAAWQHEYGDTAYALDSSFANGAADSFTVNGPRIGRDSALLGAGFAIQFNDRCSTYFYYDGELGRTNYQSTSVTGGVRVAF